MISPKHENFEDLELKEIELDRQWEKIYFEKIHTAEFWGEFATLLALYFDWMSLYFDWQETIAPKPEDEGPIVGARLKEDVSSDAPQGEPKGFFNELGKKIDTKKSSEEEKSEKEESIYYVPGLDLSDEEDDDDATITSFDSESFMSEDDFDASFEKEFKEFSNDDAEISGDESQDDQNAAVA
ncbi:MAG: hypothetical protein RLN62_04405 [Rickettsiales bacterium]